MHKLLVLIILCGTTLGALESPDPRWETKIADIESREMQSPVGEAFILFTGSSSIRLWETLADDFFEHPVVNRGFGGSQISDLVGYFDRVILPGHPRQIIIYAGTNDMNKGESAVQVFADFATLCGMIERALPNTKIALLSCAPNPARWAQREEQETFNRLASFYCERMGYDFIDVWTPMLGDDGTPSRAIYVEDDLHLNAAGYALWREIVRPFLGR